MKKTFLFFIIIMLAACYLYAADFPKIKDLKPESEAISYDPENLYEYINGAADAYLAYGFENCKTRDFSYKALKFSIDIYEMGSRINAFGMYQTERPTGAKGLKIGIDAVVSPPYQCLLLKGSNYIKINIFEGEFTVESGKQILQAVAATLKGSNNLPNELKLLPPKYKIANSSGYNLDAYLGLSILQRCVYAKYKIENKTVQFYVIVPTNKEPLQAAWKKLIDKWEKVTFNGQTILFKKIPYKGFTGVVQKDGKILGIAECENKEQMLKLLKTQL
jgi:hypothetical protein